MRRITLTQDHTLPVRIQKTLIKSTFDKTTKTETVLSHGFKIYQIIIALEQANIQTEIANDMIKQQYEKARQTQTARLQQPYHSNTQNNQN